MIANAIDGASDTGILINGQTPNDLSGGRTIARTQGAGIDVQPC